MRTGKQAGFIKLLVIIILVVVAGVIILAARSGNDSSANNPVGNPSTNSTGGKNTSPDKVKSKNGANTDTQPSSNGTGPGSDNSLLSQ